MNDILQQIDVDALKAEKCRRDFYYFFKEFWDTIIPEELIENWHLKVLCDEVQEVGEKIINREPCYDLVINISPGTTKSTIISIMFPAWIWAKDPTLRFITGSHSKSLALTLGVKARDIIKSEKYQRYFNVVLKSDNNNKGLYGNEEGGSRVSTSVGSGIIGEHAHAIIIDDPVEVNPSYGKIRDANQWLTNDLATRKVDKKNTPTILIMQRIANNDPTTHLLSKSTNVRHICLPAVSTDDVKPSEYKEYYENGLMDKNRLSYDVLSDMQSKLGTYGYTSQFLQTPQTPDGGTIKRSWCEVVPYSEVLDDIAPNFYLDTAYTEDEDNNDPTALLVTKKFNHILYIIDVYEVWKEFNELVKWIPSILDNHGYKNNSKVYIEPKASGKSIVSYLKKQTPYNVIEDDPPKDNKLTRLKSVSPKIEAGKVVFIKGDHTESLIDQLTATKPAHDDMRDTIVMAIRRELITNKGTYHYK